MRKKIFLYLIAALFAAGNINAQTNTFPSTGSAGIGTITPNASSILDMSSTTQGMLVPRMTKAQRDAIVSPATGLMIYQTNSSPGFYFYNGTIWAAVTFKGANTSLSNLTAPTAVNADILPGADNSINLGSSLQRYKNISLYNLVFSDGTTQTTAFTPYAAGNGINIGGGIISNTAPDQTVTLTGSGATTVTGTYPNFTISSTDNNTTYTPGTGININNGTINNTAPDQTVTLTGSGATTVTGTYPNFTISSTDNNTTYTPGTGIDITGNTITNTAPSQWNSSGANINFSSGNVGIGTAFPQKKLHVSGGDLFVESAFGSFGLGYSGSNQWKFFTTGGGADLRIGTTTDGVNFTPRHYFSQNGDVGIGGFGGVGIPQARLDVVGNGTASSTNTFMLRNSIGDTLMRVRDDGRIGIGYNPSSNSLGRTLNIGGTGINFYTASESGFGGAVFPTDTSLVIWSNSNANNYLVMQPSWGNMGIGLYNPQAKLNVVGATATINSGGYIVAGKVISTNVAIDNTQILARNNGLAATLKINDNSGNTLINPTGTGKVGIGTAAPTHKLQLGTDDAAKPSTSTWTIVSDARLKTNIKDFTEGLDVVKKIHPVWFEYNGNANMPKGIKSVGILAQEMQKIAPYMIDKFNYTDDNGKTDEYLDYNANDLFYLLVNSVKELAAKNEAIESEKEQQQKINADLQKQIDELKKAIGNQVSGISNQASAAGNQQTIIISDKQAASLSQNIPNPFSSSTNISCFLPVNNGNAYINFYSQTGALLKSVKITGTGNNTIMLKASELSAGTYKYALIVDGKLIDSKTMILSAK